MSEASSKRKRLGTLVVVVLKARHLKDSHTFYKQDPYALIRLGETVKQTKPDQRGGQHPVWDEEFRIPILEAVPGLDLRTLKVSAFSKESRVDELIGEGLLDISDTLKRGEFDDWVKLELNEAFRGEIYLEMTYYSVDPPLTRRPSKLLPHDRLWRPPVTPPKDTTSPYLSPQRSPQIVPTPLADTPPHINPSIPIQLQPGTNPRPHSSQLPTTSSPRRTESPLPPIPSEAVQRPLGDVSPRLTPSIPIQLQPAANSHSHSSQLPITSSPRWAESSLPPVPREFLQPVIHPIPSTNHPYLDIVPPLPPRSPQVDPTLRNIPSLDVSPSHFATPPTTSTMLHSVPSILRPRNVKSSPIPLRQRDSSASPSRQDCNDPNKLFQEQLAESDAAFAVRLAQSEGIDLERLRMEEADAALARQLANEDGLPNNQGNEYSIPGGWIG